MSFGIKIDLPQRSRVESVEFVLLSAPYKGLALAVFWQYSDSEVLFKYPQLEVFNWYALNHF